MKSRKTKQSRVLIGIMTVSILLITLGTLHILEKLITAQQDDELRLLTRYIDHDIDNVIRVNKVIQAYQFKVMEGILKDISNRWAGRDYTLIPQSELTAMIEEYQIAGLDILTAKGDDIIIMRSGASGIEGKSTKQWGFWFKAFDQLLKLGRTTLSKGMASGPMWMGPRAFSSSQDGFFLFTYYKVPDLPFLINVYIDDKEAFNIRQTGNTNGVLRNLVDSSEFIEEIGIINTRAWNRHFNQNKRSAVQEMTIQYGTYKSVSAEDNHYLNKVLENPEGEALVAEVLVDDKKKTKWYTRIDDANVIVFVLDRQKHFMTRNWMIITVVTGVLTLCLIGYFILRYYAGQYKRLLLLKQKRLAVAESYRQTVQVLPSVVLRLRVHSDALVIRHCEGKALPVFGLDHEKIEGNDLSQYLPKAYLEKIKSILGEGTDGPSFEFAFENQVFENMVEPVANPDGGILECIVLATDITRLRRSEDRARFMAYHDTLTGLPNRHFFKEQVEERINTRNQGFYIAFIDLDGFKAVNDTAGHDVGDLLLKDVAALLKQNIRQKDCVARMGGDEFALLIASGETRQAVEILMTRLKSAISKTHHLKTHTFDISMSAGLSRYPQDGSSYVDLLRNADIAMYHVKFSGKNGHLYFQPEMDTPHPNLP